MPTDEQMAAILKALGVNVEMAAIAVELGMEPCDCEKGEYGIQKCLGLWEGPMIERRVLYFTETVSQYNHEYWEYDYAPEDDTDEDGERYEDAYPWGQFYVIDLKNDETTGYPIEQREAAIRHWKEGITNA